MTVACTFVNAVVEAAFIGVAGTVIVGVAGFGASIWNTRKAFTANRQSWIRDQRATAYVDAIAAMHYRQFARQVTAGHGPPTDQAKSQALATYKKPDWNVLEARLLAFGSQPVFTAMQTGAHADLRVAEASEACKAATDADAAALHSKYQRAMQEADDADDALIDLVRTELQGKGPALGDWEPIAPVSTVALRRSGDGE